MTRYNSPSEEWGEVILIISSEVSFSAVLWVVRVRKEDREAGSCSVLICYFHLWPAYCTVEATTLTFLSCATLPDKSGNPIQLFSIQLLQTPEVKGQTKLDQLVLMYWQWCHKLTGSLLAEPSKGIMRSGTPRQCFQGHVRGTVNTNNANVFWRWRILLSDVRTQWATQWISLSMVIVLYQL